MGEAEWNADPKERDAARCSRSAAQSRAQPACLHLIMGSVIESATTPLDGFNTGFFMCGVIMLVGGTIAMALVNPERAALAVRCAKSTALHGDIGQFCHQRRDECW